MKVLAIETSCDETAAAILENQADGAIRVISNVVYSQMDLHKKYGGVYPELASREHVAKIQLVIEKSISDASQNYSGIRHSSRSFDRGSSIVESGEFGITYQDWLKDNIDLLAVTAGPGLIGSLLVGVNVAKTLAYAFNKPILGINHHEGHIAAAWINPRSSKITNDESRMTKLPAHGQNTSEVSARADSCEVGEELIIHNLVPELPALALVVSGGHTQLVLIKKIGQFEVLGKTRDDAAGEAFDKVARLLGLEYPGGPAIAAEAAKLSTVPDSTIEDPRSKDRDTCQLSTVAKLPRPMLDSGDLDFSFSGLKTAVAQLVARSAPLTPAKKAAIAHEFQEAAVEVLVTKTRRAVEQYRPKSLIVAGGVAANNRLREALIRNHQLSTINYQMYIPDLEYCTDNAAMIGAAALLRAHQGATGTWQTVSANDALSL